MNANRWTTINDLRRQVQTLWDRGILLSSMLNGAPVFPKRLVLKTPTSRELSDCYGDVRQWIAGLAHPAFRIETKTIRHRLLGANQVPTSAWVDNFDNAVAIIGRRKEARLFTNLLSITRQRRPELLPWINAQPLKALALTADWPRLIDVIDWVKAHPKPGVYLRQADIAGVDTKFIERYRGVLMALLDLCLDCDNIREDARGANQFEARYGFRQKPVRIRFRILDPDIQLIGRASQDIMIGQDVLRTLDTDARFKGRVRKVFITENEINFLSFPEVKNGLVLFGAGYGFEALRDVPWLSALNVYYWGDIDTHGFAILDQLRSILPHAQSLLMDEATLIAHKAFWEQETKPEHRKLEKLTTAEQALYKDLCSNRFAPTLRLEQERIGFNWVCRALEQTH